MINQLKMQIKEHRSSLWVEGITEQ